jgi:uncharacterized membrane protein
VTRSKTSFRDHWGLYVMAAVYFLAGVNHFISPELYLRIMPSYIPEHALMVQLSGVAEILLGVGLVWPPTRRWAAWGVIALLIAITPAHIFMIQEHATLFSEVPLWGLYLRLPLQLLLMFWAYQYTKKTGHKSRYV